MPSNTPPRNPDNRQGVHMTCAVLHDLEGWSIAPPVRVEDYRPLVNGEIGAPKYARHRGRFLGGAVERK